MAEYTAITEAGTALIELLRDNLTPEPIGNRELINLCSPHESENNQLTAYLYQIEEDTQGVTAGYFSVDSETERMRGAQYILHFLLTPHSKAPQQTREADQYRILGAAVQALRDNPVIPQRFLTGSLAAENAQVHIQIEKMNMEQLLKIWNNTNKEYKASVALTLTGVTIDSKRVRRVSRVTEVVIGTREKKGETK
jgi:restriction endonuclease